MFKPTPDVTERLLAVLVRKCTVIPKDAGRPYFVWKGFGGDLEDPNVWLSEHLNR